METALVNGKRGLGCLLLVLVWACGNGGDLPPTNEGGGSDPTPQDVTDTIEEDPLVGDLDVVIPTDEEPGGAEDLSVPGPDNAEVDVPTVPELHPQCFANSHCDDEDPCTLDHCDEDKQCAYDPVPCDDGDPCTLGTCVAEQGCVYEPIPDCIPSNCETDQDCVDENPCTLEEKCVGGGCSYTSMDCDDSKPCSLDFCDPDTGKCAYQGNCDDGDACTYAFCDPAAGYICKHGKLKCGDGDDCTQDTCDKELGCVYSLLPDCPSICQTDGDCDDQDPCTDDLCGDGACNNWPSGECCKNALDCDDADPCTYDWCATPGGTDPKKQCKHVSLPGCS